MRMVAVLKYVTLVVGIGLLMGAGYFYQRSSAFLDEALSVEGTVVRLAESRSNDSTTYRPVVQYTTRDAVSVEFTSPVGRNPPGYSPGQSVEVLYDPNDPWNARISGFFSLWGIPLILAGLGGLFSLVGAAALLMKRLMRRTNEALRRSGIRIDTRFQGVERNTTLSVNGKVPFRVVTQWQNPATSQVHVFRSHNLWFDPSPYIDSDSIAVFIEPGKPQKYYVDLSFLPELAE